MRKVQDWETCMDCPVCHKAFIVVEREGIELDYCFHCCGVWFDSHELELLMEALPQASAKVDWGALSSIQSHERSYRCPRCRQKMDKIQIGADNDKRVTLDRCPKGEGIWLDKGELADVIQFHRSQVNGVPENQLITLDFIGKTLSP